MADLNVDSIGESTAGAGITTTHKLTLVAGTNTAAPIIFTSGTNLTNAVAGTMEFDGTVFYNTPVASARALNVGTMYSIVPAATFALLTTSGVQSCFPTTGDVWTLPATTSYFFEGAYYITHTTTTCTTAMAFACSNAPTSIAYNVISVINAADGAPAAASMTWVDTVASTVVAATSTVGWAIRFRGILRTNLATTVTPQINFSANTTVPVMQANSYITMTPLGTNTASILGSVG